MTTFNRRVFLQQLGGAAMAAAAGRPLLADGEDQFPPHRFITKGPRHHWFGYYDKLQFSPTGRYVLGMQVPFEHRSPTADDVIQIGMIDLEDDDRWINLGESRAWNWQQGCMLQWLPGSDSTVVWNDRVDDRFVCHMMDVQSQATRTVAHPIYSLSPDGRSAVAPDFRRIADTRPGYGYTGLSEPYGEDLAPEETGIFHIDLQTGVSRLIVRLADVARIGEIPFAVSGMKHYFNHLLFSPDGSRFIFLHRWKQPGGRFYSRMLTANPDGSDLHVVIPNGWVSHFIWRDPQHILSQSKDQLGNPDWGDFLFADREDGILKEIGDGVLDPNGHLTYLPGNEWILNDTYPKGADRIQTPHLYHIDSNRRIDLGHFHLPRAYTGEWRVDTHPRLSRDARTVCIDAVDGDNGRQLCLIDISGIVE